MNLSLVLGFVLCAFSLHVLVQAESEPQNDVGWSFSGMFNFLSSDNSVKFFLYNREIENPEVYKALVRRRSFLPSFRHNKPLKVVIHGWMGKDNKTFCSRLKDGLLKNQDVNVITVDWSDNGSRNWLYPVSRNRVPEVAEIVAEFLDNLNKKFKVRLEDIHVIGHSLGAHISGLAGKKVTTGKIGRITGLDPAGPSFSVKRPEERLTEESAIFVDVIHTCATMLGITEPIGHADFYPNDGNWKQPGCGFDVYGACSHTRSQYLYLESLENKKAFPAVPCPSWDDFENNKKSCDLGKKVYMGEGLSRSAKGVYYLETNKQSPFGLGKV
ncbi:lipase member H [Halyomorpha halys]|uniref:lipase member H n=1 Tax=Halyomorpha halys TaxID=286706 RepID=UPI0006D50C63|nr:lipase member H-like [Halyomorpha halys]